MSSTKRDSSVWFGGRTLFAALFGLAALIGALVWFDPQFIGRPLSLPLEQRFPACPLAELQPVAGVVMLAGDFERVKAAIDLGARLPAARLLISAGGESPRIVAYAAEHGVAADRLTLFDGPENTLKEAEVAMKLAAPRAGDRWLLVTSAKHVPRSAGVFWKLGFEVTPWPVYPTEYKTDRYSMREAFREWGALVSYWMMGRTTALMPHPRLTCQAAAGGQQ